MALCCLIQYGVLLQRGNAALGTVLIEQIEGRDLRAAARVLRR